MNRQRHSTRPLPPRKLPTECLCCGEVDPWVINKVEFTAPFRDTEHLVRAEVNQCRHCDAISTTEEQSAVISALVRDVHQRWISEKLKKAQKELGMSLRDLAEKSRIPFATLGRISSGEHLIEATMEKLLWLEIGKLNQARITERWLQMGQQAFRVTNGTVRVNSDPKQAGLYSRILKAAAQSPLGKSGDFEREGDFLNPSYSNPVAA